MPNHDKTPEDEFQEAIKAAVEAGEMVEDPPGSFSLTELGKRKVEALLAESREASEFFAAAKGSNNHVS